MDPSQHQLAFLMLAHEHPQLCARLARHLLDGGHRLVVHLDGKVGDDFRSDFDQALGAQAEAVEWCQRWSVAWGEWSMVRATLAGLETLAASGPTPSHVYLISGADYPLRPLDELQAFLARHASRDFIEHRDVRNGRWVKRGPQESRYEAWHFFNWRSRPRLFSWSLKLQHRLGIRRTLPVGLQPHFGSQWWVLSWRSCQLAMELAARPEVDRFFRRSWVPDELFFQSVVASRRKPENVDQRHLTYYQFTPFGVPLVLHDGHEAFLKAQPFFFARKLDPEAGALRDALDQQLAVKAVGAAGETALAGTEADAPPREMLDDLTVGYATEDYDRFLHEHRHGIYGQRSWGHPGDACLGALARNRKPYRVLIGEANETLRAALAQLAETVGGSDKLAENQDLTVHGQLFARKQIHFAGEAQQFAGYDRHAVAIRDQDAPAFLSDVLACSPGAGAAFAILLDRSPSDTQEPTVMAGHRTPHKNSVETGRAEFRLLARLLRDPRCEIIHLGDPASGRRWHDALAAYAEEYWPRRIRACWTQVDTTANAHDLSAQLASLPDDRSLTPEVTGVSQRRPKRLVLHIGVHRTGTTAIQRLLHANREELKGQDIHYGFETENHTWLASGLQGSDEAAARCVESVIEDALAAGKGTTIISGEDLCRIVHVDRLAAFREHFEVQVVVYLRRQDSWLESWYNQNIRWPWELETSHFTPAVFLQRRERFHWLDYGVMLRRWCDVFGQENVTVRVFEEARRQQPFTDDFCQLCGIDTAALSKPKRAQNASVSPAAGELLRHLHLFSRDPIDRMVLIRLTAEAYAAEGLDQERHIYSAQARRRLQATFAATNRWVAKALLNRPDGELFPPASPQDGGHTRYPALPEQDQLIGLVGRHIANALIALIMETPAGPTVAAPMRERLLRMEHRRRQLRGERNVLYYQLTPRRPLRSNFRNLAQKIETFGVQPRSTLTLPLQDRGAAAEWSAAARRLASALGWAEAIELRDETGATMDASLRLQRQTLARWQELTGTNIDKWRAEWPAPAQLVSDVLEPLLDLLLTELSVTRRLSGMDETEALTLYETLEHRLGKLERRVKRLRGASRSRSGRLLHLLFNDRAASDRRQDEILVGRPDPLPDEPGPEQGKSRKTAD